MDTITDSNKEYLRGFADTITLERHRASFLLVHGSPKSNKQYVFENHREEELVEWFEKFDVNMILSGHTHQSYIRTIQVGSKERKWINVGSVGRTKENIGARAVYLQLDIAPNGKVEIKHKQVEYDIAKTIDAIENSPVPNYYANFLKRNNEE